MVKWTGRSWVPGVLDVAKVVAHGEVLADIVEDGEYVGYVEFPTPLEGPEAHYFVNLGQWLGYSKPDFLAIVLQKIENYEGDFAGFKFSGNTQNARVSYVVVRLT